MGPLDGTGGPDAGGDDTADVLPAQVGMKSRLFILFDFVLLQPLLYKAFALGVIRSVDPEAVAVIDNQYLSGIGAVTRHLTVFSVLLLIGSGVVRIRISTGNKWKKGRVASRPKVVGLKTIS